MKKGCGEKGTREWYEDGRYDGMEVHGCTTLYVCSRCGKNTEGAVKRKTLQMTGWSKQNREH